MAMQSTLKSRQARARQTVCWVNDGDELATSSVAAWGEARAALTREVLTRLRRLRSARGVTLFEVLIVVAILAMVAGGVAVFALPKFRDSQIKVAESGARVMRQAVQSWQAANNETSCPTVSQLIQDKQLDSAQNTNDPWGQAYVLNCSDDEVTVISNGPDKKKGSKDDISVPKGAAQASE